jgi:hypothetical protein
VGCHPRASEMPSHVSFLSTTFSISVN